jgi:hypothetical protein
MTVHLILKPSIYCEASLDIELDAHPLVSRGSNLLSAGAPVDLDSVLLARRAAIYSNPESSSMKRNDPTQKTIGRLISPSIITLYELKTSPAQQMDRGI